MSPARLVALLALAAALWASQALALMHQVSHRHGQAHTGEMFAHLDDDPAQCRLVDQLAQLAPPNVAPATLLLEAATTTAAAPYASRPAGSAAAGYLARAAPART